MARPGPTTLTYESTSLRARKALLHLSALSQKMGGAKAPPSAAASQSLGSYGTWPYGRRMPALGRCAARRQAGPLAGMPFAS